MGSCCKCDHCIKPQFHQCCIWGVVLEELIMISSLYLCIELNHHGIYGQGNVTYWLPWYFKGCAMLRINSWHLTMMRTKKLTLGSVLLVLHAQISWTFCHLVDCAFGKIVMRCSDKYNLQYLYNCYNYNYSCSYCHYGVAVWIMRVWF